MGTPIHVLHIEDNEGIAELTATFLEKNNDRIRVETAGNPAEGMERLDSDSVDCIVSDHDMPGKNGIEFLEAVREEYPTLPFILFTGKGSEEVASQAISAGVSDYLQKQTGTEQYELLGRRIITHVERTRAQRELEERESHLRQAQVVAELGSWQTDISADEIYWSDPVYEIFGIDDTEGSLSYEQFLEYVHPDDRETVDAAWSAALDGEEYDIEHRIVTDDGEIRWVRERADVGFDENGTPETALGIVQDITTEKEREKQLQQASARLKALFKGTPDMINIHNSEGDIISPNPRFCERTGYSDTELADMKVWELDQELDPEEAREIWRGMQPDEDLKLESTYRSCDGSTFPVEVHIRRLDQPMSDHFAVISRELTSSLM
ncbi:PAS domain-containing response regulator [Halobellus rarus]|uniref:histidine kinase n=1 Tax=Halobellus rarus TaxID=1126237 RepID=A0ABD6CSY7_9EURY|nr:PAS domain S-box protein [Halobellus rarus]